MLLASMPASSLVPAGEAGSPPGSTSVIYRANSLVSHTAAPRMGVRRRNDMLAAASMPLGPTPVRCSSPNTSQAEVCAKCQMTSSLLFWFSLMF
jgi:hypothetical protein